MYISKCFFGCLLLLPLFCFGQKETVIKTKKHQLAFALNAGVTNDRLGEHNNGINPDPIEIHMPIVYKLNPMLTYQHNTPYGFIYGGGIQFGTYRRNETVLFSPYDTANNMEPLKGKRYIYGFNERSHYIGVNLFVGYNYPLTPKKANPLYLETKIGITERFYFSGGELTDLDLMRIPVFGTVLLKVSNLHMLLIGGAMSITSRCSSMAISASENRWIGFVKILSSV